MAKIHELIDRVTEPELKAELQAAVEKLSEQKQFGLVFEEPRPECTLLYEVPVRKGRLVFPAQAAFRQAGMDGLRPSISFWRDFCGNTSR